MVGRIREIVFEDGVNVDGTVTTAASTAYVDALFDPITGNDKGIYLDNTSGLPTLSPWRPGVLAWDTEHDCLAVSTLFDGSWLQVGQEAQDNFYNDTGAQLTNGTVVYIDGAQGHRPEIKKASCSTEEIAKKTIGLVTADIDDKAEGPVCLSGQLHGINTNSYNVGDILWLNTTAGTFTSTQPSYQYEHIMVGIVLEKSPTDGVIYVCVKDLTDQIAKMGYYIVDPHGFTEYDNTYMTRSWVGNTFTLTQVGTSTPYYHKGKLKFLSGNKSINVTPTAGAHFIGLNCTTEVLEDLGGTIPAASVVSTHILCEFAYANGTDVIYYANERHSTKFPKMIWFFNHLYLSTQYRSGLQPSITSIDGNGSNIDHARWSVTTGIIADEDIEITVAALTSAETKTIWYYNGTVWVKYSETNGTGVITSGSGRASYNNYTTGLAEATNNYHVLTHLFAANDGTVIAIIGNAEYQLMSAARIAASTEIATLLTTGLPFPEFRAIATFINKTSNSYSNAVKSIIVSVDTGVSFIDWRKTALNPAAGQSAANHQNLAGLQGGQAGEYYHLTSSDYNNIVNKIFPGGAASDTGAKLIVPTKADTSGLTATAGNLMFDTTKKKLQAADGSNWKIVGGGLVVTPVTVSGTTPSIATIENGKHLIVDMSTATGDVNLTAPAGESEANWKVTATRNYSNAWRVTITAAGSDKFYYVGDSTSYNVIRIYNPDSWIEACYLTTNVWVLNTDENSGTGSASGTGRKNYIKNPSAFSSFTDYWTAANITVTRDTSTSIPRETTTGTAFKLVSTAGSSTATFLSDAMLLDDADLNKKLGVELAINVADSTNWSIDILASATSGGTYSRLVLSTDSSSISYLPATTGVFKTTFDSVAATPYIKFRITSAATSKTAYFSDIIITPDGSVVQGAVVGSPVDISGFTLGNAAAGYTLDIVGSRHGSELLIKGALLLNGANTNYLALIFPSNLTIDQAALPLGNAGTQSSQLVGNATYRDASPVAVYGYYVWVDGATNRVYFKRADGDNAEISASAPVTAASGDVITIDIRVPIAEWAGSGTVNLAGNDVEFLSNSTSFGTTNTNAFQYGPAGQAIAGLADPGTTTYQRVRAQSPIQNTDMLVVELSTDRVVWTSPASARINGIPLVQGVDASGTNFAGIWMERVSGSTTDIDVYFGRYMSIANDDDPIVNWPTSNAYWRVRKTSAGAAVGFGIVQPGVSAGLVSASGLPGRTDGATVASGYVGQSSITAGGSITALSGSSTVTLDTVELPSTGGVFLVEGLFSNVKVTANGGFIYANISRDSGGYSILREERFTNDSADLITSGLCSFTTVVNIASGLTAAQRTVAARMQATSTVTGEAQGRIQYIRIA